ncbi:MAG: hypothetical protein ACK4S4_15580 [Pyrinomonadaceae bacterium]
MGTRGLTCVVVDGEFKVAQYGQWDHYPEGQGKTIAEFMQKIYDDGRLDEFRAAVRECRRITPKEHKARWERVVGKPIPESGLVLMDDADKFRKVYPELDRDAGGEILDLVMNGARDLQLEVEFAADSLFCEWAYVVDLDNEMIEVYAGFNKDRPKGRFARIKLPKDRHHDYKQITLFHKFPIKDAVAGIDETIRMNEERGDDD